MSSFEVCFFRFFKRDDLRTKKHYHKKDDLNKNTFKTLKNNALIFFSTLLKKM